jgi:hypothetical protein
MAIHGMDSSEVRDGPMHLLIALQLCRSPGQPWALGGVEESMKSSFQGGVECLEKCYIYIKGTSFAKRTNISFH